MPALLEINGFSLPPIVRTGVPAHQWLLGLPPAEMSAIAAQPTDMTATVAEPPDVNTLTHRQLLLLALKDYDAAERLAFQSTREMPRTGKSRCSSEFEAAMARRDAMAAVIDDLGVSSAPIHIGTGEKWDFWDDLNVPVKSLT